MLNIGDKSSVVSEESLSEPFLSSLPWSVFISFSGDFMKHMYDIVPRGNEYIYGKILLDNFNVCHSCWQFYPIDRCPDAVLADPKLLSKKSVYDFIISDKVYNNNFSVNIAKKVFSNNWDGMMC
jgi:hypothetical protein